MSAAKKTEPQINDNTVILDSPIKREGGDITAIELRKPLSGEMRGISLLDLLQLEVDALIKVIPRVSQPAVSPTEVQKMDLSDLTACGGKIANFLAQKSQKEQYPAL